MKDAKRYQSLVQPNSSALGEPLLERMSREERRVFAWERLWERHFARKGDTYREEDNVARRKEKWRLELSEYASSDWRTLLTPMACKRLRALIHTPGIFDEFFSKIMALVSAGTGVQLEEV